MCNVEIKLRLCTVHCIPVTILSSICVLDVVRNDTFEYSDQNIAALGVLNIYSQNRTSQSDEKGTATPMAHIDPLSFWNIWG